MNNNGLVLECDFTPDSKYVYSGMCVLMTYKGVIKGQLKLVKPVMAS